MKKSLTAELKKAGNTTTDLKAAEAVIIAKESESVFDAVLLAYALGYNRGRKAERLSRREKSTKTQAKQINDLYSTDEIKTMLKRLKKGTLADLTKEQASRIIERRL